MRLDRKKKEVVAVIVVGAIAALILLVSYKVFASENVSDDYTDEEKKLMRLLSEIDGVGDVEVAVSRSDGNTGVIVVCEGADDIFVRADILRVTALTTGAEKDNILIYKMSNN